MSYIIVMRNPRNKKLLAIVDRDDNVDEFATAADAERIAEGAEICRAWGYEILEVTQS